MVKFKHLKSFNEATKTEEVDKIWFADRSEWDAERNKLNVADDDINWSKDYKDKIIAFWYEDRNEGWIKK